MGGIASGASAIGSLLGSGGTESQSQSSSESRQAVWVPTPEGIKQSMAVFQEAIDSGTLELRTGAESAREEYRDYTSAGEAALAELRTLSGLAPRDRMEDAVFKLEEAQEGSFGAKDLSKPGKQIIDQEYVYKEDPAYSNAYFLGIEDADWYSETGVKRWAAATGTVASRFDPEKKEWVGYNAEYKNAAMRGELNGGGTIEDPEEERYRKVLADQLAQGKELEEFSAADQKIIRLQTGEINARTSMLEAQTALRKYSDATDPTERAKYRDDALAAIGTAEENIDYLMMNGQHKYDLEGMGKIRSQIGSARGIVDAEYSENPLSKPTGEEINAQLQETPGYQFALQQGTQNLSRQKAAQGLLQSGNFATAVNQYSQGLASLTLEQERNRLASIAQMGAPFTQSTGQSFETQGSNLANLFMQNGAFQAQGTQGQTGRFVTSPWTSRSSSSSSSKGGGSGLGGLF